MATTITAADYRGELVTGKRWRRAARVTILNAYMSPATVSFDEEEVTELEGKVATRGTETLSMVVDLAAQVPLMNPETGEPLGVSIAQRDVYVALYSVYRMLAEQRDQKNNKG